MSDRFNITCYIESSDYGDKIITDFLIEEWDGDRVYTVFFQTESHIHLFTHDVSRDGSTISSNGVMVPWVDTGSWKYPWNRENEGEITYIFAHSPTYMSITGYGEPIQTSEAELLEELANYRSRWE